MRTSVREKNVKRLQKYLRKKDTLGENNAVDL